MHNEFVKISIHYTEFMIKVLVRKQYIFNAIIFLKKLRIFIFEHSIIGPKYM